MESGCRFQGRHYPPGIVGFPARLTGQGFFPGGDGLWRDDNDLKSASDGMLPNNGVLFLGNDFGSLKGFAKLRGFENPPTWRHLRARISAAGIPTRACFFTNAFVGLREKNQALDKMNWLSVPEFCAFCAEFLQFQIEQVAPKLVVLMGSHAQAAFDHLVARRSLGAAFIILRTSHPYGDFGFTPERRSADAKILADSWAAAR